MTIAEILAELAHLDVVFILQLPCTATYVSWRINNIANYANFSNNDAREVEFGSFHGRYDGEYSGAGLVEISEIIRTQDDISSIGGIVWRMFCLKEPTVYPCSYSLV